MSASTALAKRRDESMALMPPPLLKRTKRPATVLDEDQYTNALSDIIARDYFPGLAEAKAQEEYLTALDSKNDAWIREAGQKLKQTMTPTPESKPRKTSTDARFDTPRSWHNRTPVPDTPRGNGAAGIQTPMTVIGSDFSEEDDQKPVIDTSKMSLTSFQAKYTSEDNESFNTLLDKQNNTRRKKYAHLWTADQRIPSQHLLTHRANEDAIKIARSNHDAIAAKHNETALVPLTVGAISTRPASVQSWQQKTPQNNLMFLPEGIDDTGLQTIMEAKEAASKAGPKETVFANTRFPSLLDLNNDNPSSIPPSPSLDTQIIANRDARRAQKPYSSAPTEPSSFGGDTPRVNGYSFVDEDEPSDIPAAKDEPTYRDLLAGQVGSSTPNPFYLSETRRREDLHLRLVAKDQARQREKEKQTVRSEKGNMTPAARILMQKIGKTPVRSSGIEDTAGREMWTPGATPRRQR